MRAMGRKNEELSFFDLILSSSHSIPASSVDAVDEHVFLDSLFACPIVMGCVRIIANVRYIEA
jgi:hypothetical protein